jgi:protein TonB
MFETSVVRLDGAPGERRVGLLTMSVAVHVAVVAAVILASIRTIDFPTRAPNEYALPILAAPVPMPPPALGVPNGGHKAAAPPQVKPHTVTAPPADAAPSTIPQQVQPATSGVPSAQTTDTGSGTTDQPVGVPWGVKDGIGVDGPPSTATVEQIPAAPLRIEGDVKAPVVVHRVTPTYPRAALAARMNGMVIVECIIDRNGHVRDARVLRSSSPFFAQPAVDAVQQWQFTPGSLHGTAIDTIFDLTVTFRVSL